MAKGKAKGGKVAAKLNYSRPPRNPRAGTAVSLPKGAHEQTCSLNDPWCPAARGAKIPDDDSTRSVAYQQRFMGTVGSDANGRIAIQVRPQPCNVNTVQLGATITATQVTSWTAAGAPVDPSAAEMLLAAQTYRFVSWGVRCYPLLAPTNQSGSIKFMSVSDGAAAAPFLYNGGAFEVVSMYAVANSDVHWVSKPIGNEWKNYTTLGSEGASFETLVIVIEGLPAATAGAFEVEIICNLELQPKPNSIVASLATAALGSSTTVLKAAAQLQSHGNVGTHNGSTASFSSKIFKLSRDALAFTARTAIPFLGNMAGDYIQSRVFGGTPFRGSRKMLGNVPIEEVD